MSRRDKPAGSPGFETAVNKSIACQAAQTFPNVPPIRSSREADFADDTEDRGTNVGNPSHTARFGVYNESLRNSVPALAIGTYTSFHHCAGGRHACEISRRWAESPLPRHPAPDPGSLGGRGTSRRSSDITKDEKPGGEARGQAEGQARRTRRRRSRGRRSTPSPWTTSPGATSSTGSPTSRAWPSPALTSRRAPSPSPRPRGRNTPSRKSLTSSTRRCWPTRTRGSTFWSAGRRRSPSSRRTRRSTRTWSRTWTSPTWRSTGEPRLSASING